MAKLDVHNAEKSQPESKSTEYEPYDFADVRNPVGYFGAVVHIMRSSVGMGILALPFINSRIGYISAILVIITVGVLYFHIIHILVSAEYKLCKITRTPKMTYLRMVEQTFESVPCKVNKILSPLVRSTVILYYGLPVTIAMDLIMISANIQNIFLCFGTNISIYMTSVVILPLTLLCWIRNLKYLVPFSTVTNLFTLAAVCIVIGYSLNVQDSEITPTRAVGDMSYVPQSFAIVLAAYRATGIYLPLKNELKSPKQFSSFFGVVNISACIMIMLYIGFGLITYWRYGNKVHENILMNLPEQEILSVVIRILYTAAMFISYTLHFYVVFDTSWTSMLELKVNKVKGKIVLEYAFRTGLNIMSYVMAMSIPNFALLSAISGTLGILVEIAIPPLLDSFLTVKFNENKWWICVTVTKNILIIIIALSLFVGSVQGCVKQIIQFYEF